MSGRYSQEAKKLVDQLTVEESASLLRFDSPAIERLGIPAYTWWNEALHGVARAGTATVFPQSIGLAASFDPALLKLVATAIALEGRAKYNICSADGDTGRYKGLTFWSPNVNIFRDPRWGRGQETYGEDPYLTSVMGAAFVDGLQGDDEDHPITAACAKHFAVHSGPEKDRHHFNAIASAKDMEETYLPAFRELAEHKVLGFMGAYNRTNGEPCCASPTLQKILRGDWGWDGYFVSDCWAICDFHENHKITSRPPESAALALNYGCDINCGNVYNNLILAYDEGLISEETIRRSAVKAIEIRMKLGNIGGSIWDGVSDSVLCSKTNSDLNLKISEESLVLLKNDGLLPLDRDKVKKIAVIGPNANNETALLGNYHGVPDKSITVLEGIREAHPDADVYYTEGTHLYKDDDGGDQNSYLSEAKHMALASDVTVLVTGLDETVEGEDCGDRDSLLLPNCQRKLISAVLSVGKPVVIVNMTGCATDFDDADDKTNAIVQAWYPGALGGRAVARLLFGDFCPTGRLPVTFYRNTDPLPGFSDYSMKDRTYRYIKYKPLYEFGHGLSYTDFEYSDPVISAEEGIAEVTVKNTGSRQASTSVLLFAKADSPLSPPNPSLCGFERTVPIAPGQSVKVSVRLSKYTFTVVDDDGRRVKIPPEKVRFTVRR